MPAAGGRPIVAAMTVLVAYGSRHGSTAEIAERIADVLRAGGHQVLLEDAGTVKDLAGHDAVVLGGAVYAGRWVKSARRLLKHQIGALGQVPTWLFSSGPVDEKPLEEQPDPQDAMPPKVRAAAEQIGARGNVVFRGRVPENAENWIERKIAERIPPERHDQREWDAIEAWAQEIARALGDGATP
jgi:menaquinone-dependent protoporphyrinogen oxidase